MKKPKGFTVSIVDAINQYNLTEDQIKQLGELTAERKIAFVIHNRDVYYRKETMERLFNEEQA